MSLDDIINSIEKTVKFTTITGGEPLLQNIYPLAVALKNLGHKVLVETSGTIKPDEKLRKVIDIFSVSPKLSNAGYKYSYNFKDDDWATYYKFVIVEPERDVKEVIEFVERNYINPEKVILQPDGRGENYVVNLQRLTKTVLEMRVPFRVLPQLHRIVGVQ